MNEGAALGGQLHILEWLQSHSLLRKKYAAWFAADGGNLKVVQFTAEFEWCQTMMYRAAENDRRDVLHWLREQFGDRLRKTVGPNYLVAVVEAAASGGHWDFYKMLRDSLMLAGGEDQFVDVSYFAAMHGNIEVLQCWLEKVPARSSLIHIAALKGHVEVMQLLLEKGLALPQPEKLELGMNASLGRMNVLKFIHSNGIDLATVSNSATILNSAASSGHLELVKWLISIGIVPTKLTCLHAASSGQLALLKYFRKLPYFSSWDMRELCPNAIEFHHLRVVRWIRAGCPDDVE